ncbi:MAG: tetratricopeptide repeat protein [Myxococcota bacterium]|nr:tetratricopeptide repeat protein [Myxococcota bacterium]
MNLRVAGIAMLSFCALACSQSAGPSVKVAPETQSASESSDTRRSRAAVVGDLMGVRHGSRVDAEALRGDLLALQGDSPSDPFVLANLGTLSFRAGEWEEGLTYYQRWFEETRGRDVGVALANELARAGRLDEAEELVRELLRAHGGDVELTLGLGRLLLSRGALDEAWQVGVQLVRQAPKLEAGHTILVAVSLANGEPGLAGLLLSRAGVAGAKGPSLARARGQWLEARSLVGDALMALREAADRYPGERSIWLELGRISLVLEDYAGAGEAYETLLQREPTDRDAMLGAAVAYRGLGEWERAEAMYSRLVNDDPKSPPVLWNRAVLLHRYLGRFADAVEVYEALERLLPTPRPSIYADLEEAMQQARQAAATPVQADEPVGP